MFFKKAGENRDKAATQPAAAKPQAKPETKSVDLKATKEGLDALRKELEAIRKDANDPTKQDTAAVKAKAVEERAVALIGKADANLKQANINASTKGAGKKEDHDVGVAKGQKVAALNIAADAVQAQIPAAQAKATRTFETLKQEAIGKKQPPKVKEGESPKPAKLTQKEEANLRKKANEDVDTLKDDAKKYRSTARKIKTEAKKVQGKDARDGFMAEVRDGLKTIVNLLRNGDGSLKEQMQSAARVEAKAKTDLGVSELTDAQRGVVALRARHMPKGTHAEKATAGKAAADASPAR